MADWVSGKVTKVEYWTDALFSLYVRAPVHPFTAGQFTKLGLEIDGERVQRAYSYVNAPGNPDLEFYLVTVPEGKLSPRLAALKPGDEVLVVSEAAGFFVLEEVPDCDTLWMLATGTALGPYLSILQEGKDLERFNNLVLVHAVRYAADLSYLPLMRELEQRYAGKLRIQTVVSRETVEGSLTGRVPFLIETGALEEAVGLPMTTDTSHVMLCGNPQMVRDTQQLLKETRQMTKHLRRRPGHMTAGTTGNQASAFQRTSWVSLPNLFSPWVPTNAPRSISIMTIINVGTKRPTPHCQTCGSIAQFPASSIHARTISSAQSPDLPRSCSRLTTTAAVGHSRQTIINAAVCRLSRLLPARVNRALMVTSQMAIQIQKSRRPMRPLIENNHCCRVMRFSLSSSSA